MDKSFGCFIKQATQTSKVVAVDGEKYIKWYKIFKNDINYSKNYWIIGNINKNLMSKTRKLQVLLYFQLVSKSLDILILSWTSCFKILNECV